MVQQNPPGDEIGHVVVLVGYDPALGFKVKSSDENAGRVEWIPENRMTWFQYLVTEEEYEVVKYNSGGSGGIEKIRNGQSYFLNQSRVMKSLMRAHRNETAAIRGAIRGDMLNTNFAQRNTVFLTDFGFVLKFVKKLNCELTCEKIEKLNK